LAEQLQAGSLQYKKRAYPAITLRKGQVISSEMPRLKLPIPLLILIAGLSALLIAYSQIIAYFGDESLHLVAGQLIAAGKRPYVDFFYQHTPLWAYLVGSLVAVFGDSWRVVHVFSALLTSAAVLLAAAYAYARAEESSRLMTSIMAVLLLVENAYVISFGAVALPYALCLFLMVAAFVFITEAVNRESNTRTFLSGLCSGAAAAAYLLTAPLIPVLFIWLLINNRAGSRLRKCFSFLLGVAIPFAPLVWLAARAPRNVWFDLVQYHLFHRSGRDLGFWFNLREIAGWFISIQGALLVLLALATLLAIRKPEMPPRVRQELRLAVWIAAALTLLICVSRPVSSFYFVLITPFLVIPAAFGIDLLHERVRPSLRFLFVLAIVVVYGAGISAKRYIWRRQTTYVAHGTVKDIARIVDEVTPPAGMIYAFEAVYFEAHKLPPPGLENRFNPESKSDELLKAGRFDTVCISASNPRLREFDLLNRYHQRRTLNLNGYDFYVLWDQRPR
jgi:Dolichyl-phosphate-mannose-protein mannosyltransferase